ncbi:MAG: metal-sensitive transcriptional regulator [Candidatus Omnitrophota bacterium]|nr:metal-sensitive transcriptional regulator [Candidatus Omnitrophota bacterium]
MKSKPVHNENLPALNRIEGQIRGIRRMIGEGRYCIDIVNQILAAIHALYRVEEKIFARHIEGCVKRAFLSRSETEINKKIDEIMKVTKILRKLS